MIRFDRLRGLLLYAGLIKPDQCLTDVDLTRVLRLIELSGNTKSLSNDVLLNLIEVVGDMINTQNRNDLRMLYDMLIKERERRGL